MTEPKQAAWTGYWLGAGRDSGCLPGAPKPLNDALAGFWAELAGLLPQGGQLLDIATGSGAVVRALLALRPDLVTIGIDSAALPASDLDLRGSIDATALPFADASFDAVSSQFGIEYCAAPALAEAARVLRPGGHLAFVVHCSTSPAVAHNRARRAALVGLRDAGIFAMARQAMLTDKLDERQRRAVDAARRAHATQTIVDELPRATVRDATDELRVVAVPAGGGTALVLAASTDSVQATLLKVVNRLPELDILIENDFDKYEGGNQ